MVSGPASDASAWVQRWARLIRPGGRVLDLACGSGRHVR
ncbi:MAG TPA: SAM-dependent methyltransferase, partial [Rubrivivax sp.]|nr:SAM-dependent methyltransferase [Rubrivivax sp.]